MNKTEVWYNATFNELCEVEKLSLNAFRLTYSEFTTYSCTIVGPLTLIKYFIYIGEL